ncbi:MAG: ATP-binding protein [Lachnospiraceae bacterium]|nr:ATP-binding protein [Lachnospiraceae bacterium]
MEQLFITNITINKVRHLKDILLPLSENKMKHLILTGKNGSGKTSVVEALAEYLNAVFTDAVQNGDEEGEISRIEKSIHYYEQRINQNKKGLDIELNKKCRNMVELKEKYHYILAYYSADRIFKAEQPVHVEKIQLKNDYGIYEYPRDEFVKYLLDLKMTEALARNNNKVEKADKIKAWFEAFEQLLKKIFSDKSIELAFDEESFEFHIMQQGKEAFDFNTLSSGYQAVLDIVVDIIMRMQNQAKRVFDFRFPGIVLIDEIETHLHLELQKNIMPLLTTIFPNIQFVVTTHSPFILNSIENVVIYDLESNLLVENGLNNVPYDGIVEGYFGADRLSDTLKEKFEQYRSLVEKESLSDDEMSKIAELELYLDEIPGSIAIRGSRFVNEFHIL